MTDGSRQAARLMPRLLLLLFVVLGLAAMHTLGHAVHGGSSSQMTLSEGAPFVSASVGEHQTVIGAAHGAASSAAHHPGAPTGLAAAAKPTFDTPKGHPSLDPLSVCLAVLLAAAALAGAELVLRIWRRRPGPHAGPLGGILAAVRAPPPLGLSLTRTVVLRI